VYEKTSIAWCIFGIQKIIKYLIRMKRNSRNLILAIAAVLFVVLLPEQSNAQQNNENPENSKKTISIHVTKQVNGETITIDTTVITDGEFDADAFLREKGVLDEMPNEEMEKNFSMRAPHFEFHNFDGNFPDTMMFSDKQLKIFGDNENFNFQIPEFPTMPGMPEWNSPENGRNFNFFGNPNSLDNLLHQYASPFGNIEKVVVKKKRHGKKVIITFDDEDEKCGRKNKHSDENVYYFNHGGNAPENEMRVIIQNNDKNSKTVTVETDENAPKVKKVEKKVIIIDKK